MRAAGRTRGVQNQIFHDFGMVLGSHLENFLGSYELNSLPKSGSRQSKSPQSRATDFGSGDPPSESLQSESLLSRATDFGFGDPLTWESTVWKFTDWGSTACKSTVSSDRFWTLQPTHSTGSLQSESLESRATDFESGM